MLVRAEDLIFRWGGDEFFVIMISMDSQSARRRMGELRDLLSDAVRMRVLLLGATGLSLMLAALFEAHGSPVEIAATMARKRELYHIG